MWFRQILCFEFLFGVLKDWTSVCKETFSAYLIRTFSFRSQVRNITVSLQWSKKIDLVLQLSEMCETWPGCIKTNMAEPPNYVTWVYLAQDVMLQWIPSRSHQLNINIRNSSVGVNISVSSYLSVRPSVCLPVYTEQLGSHRTNFSWNLMVEDFSKIHWENSCLINPLKPELNLICYLLALLEAHHFFHVSRIRVKILTFRRLM